MSATRKALGDHGIRILQRHALQPVATSGGLDDHDLVAPMDPQLPLTGKRAGKGHLHTILKPSEDRRETSFGRDDLDLRGFGTILQDEPDDPHGLGATQIEHFGPNASLATSREPPVQHRREGPGIGRDTLAPFRW